MKRDAKLNRIGSLHAAIKTAWKKSKIDDTNVRLEAIRNELQFRTLISIKQKIDTQKIKQDQSFLHLSETNKSIITAIVDSKQDAQVAIFNQTAKLLSQQKEWHDAIMSAIYMSSHHIRSPPTSSQEIHEKLLESLVFSTMNDRHEDIPERHRETFDWILDDGNKKATQKQEITDEDDLVESTLKTGSDFRDWLFRGSGLYWISGKAGSGKSTLIKFLRNDNRVCKALMEWAGGHKLVTASFYFWKAGNSMQKSQVGLLRSILHAILEQNPELAPTLFPNQFRSGACWSEFPSLNHLKRALRYLATQDSTNVVLFVDGLDEFEGPDAKVRDLIQLFKTVVASNRVKMILSSRP